MSHRVLNRIPSQIITLILFSLLFFLPSLNHNVAGAEPAITNDAPSSETSKPIILYYSRSGKTRIVANALVDQLSFEIEEIKSKTVRDGYLGVFTCVLDQLLDRDDQIEQPKKDIKGYNPVIIASPIWLGNVSSPARTFIKQEWMKGKEVYVFLTYNGRLSQEKEDIMRGWITSQGVKLKGLYKIITKEKTEDEIKKEVGTQLGMTSLIKKKVISSLE